MRRLLLPLATLGLLACGADPVVDPRPDIAATQAAVERCLTTELTVPLQLPAEVPLAVVIFLDPMDRLGEPWEVYDFTTQVITLSRWDYLAGLLVHYDLDLAGMSDAENATATHPGFAQCGGADRIVWP